MYAVYRRRGIKEKWLSPDRIPQKINCGDKTSHADPGDMIEILSDDDKDMANETARAVANIPVVLDSISGIREILSQEVAEEPLLETGVSTDEIFDLLGEDTHEQLLDDMPMGLGWTWNDADGISAFSVKQRPVFTNREDIWAASVSDVNAVPTQVHEVTSGAVTVPSVVSSVAHTDSSKVAESTVSSFGSKLISAPLFSVANNETGTSVAAVSAPVTQIALQAEIQPPPRANVRSKVSKETRDLQTGAIADITAERIKHVSEYTNIPTLSSWTR